MFINAEPRHVSHGFDTFVPNYRPALHQKKLVEMTNNDINAWGIFRPVAPLTGEDWNHGLNDFASENFPVSRPVTIVYTNQGTDGVEVQGVYSEYFQNTEQQMQSLGFSKPASHSSAHQGQCNLHRRSSTQVYQAAGSEINYFEDPSSMLESSYSQWNYGQGRGSFSELSSLQNGLKEYRYQPSIEANLMSFSAMPSPSLVQSSYLEEESILGGGANMEKHSTADVYNGRVISAASMDQQYLDQYDIANRQSATRSMWWPQAIRASNNRLHTYEITTGHNDLPRYQVNQQMQEDLSDSWNMGTSTSNSWSPQANLTSNTISPEVLSLNLLTTPLSMSESSPGSGLQISDTDSSACSEDDGSDCSSPASPAALEPQRRPRQILPDSRQNLHVSSDTSGSSRSPRERPAKLTAASGGKTRQKKRGSPSTNFTSSETAPSTIHKRIEPKPIDPAQQNWSSELLSSSTAAKASHVRDAKDDFLVQSKLAGMSYKEIRRKGKFTEAESTLRGRFRTLTKHKAARVRKPEWNDNDVSPPPPSPSGNDVNADIRRSASSRKPSEDLPKAAISQSARCLGSRLRNISWTMGARTTLATPHVENVGMSFRPNHDKSQSWNASI
jgi:hypothetical protein